MIVSHCILAVEACLVLFRQPKEFLEDTHRVIHQIFSDAMIDHLHLICEFIITYIILYLDQLLGIW